MIEQFNIDDLPVAENLDEFNGQLIVSQADGLKRIEIYDFLAILGLSRADIDAMTAMKISGAFGEWNKIEKAPKTPVTEARVRELIEEWASTNG